MEENEIKQLIASELKKHEYDNAFGVSLIPYHAHTGTDSPQIDSSNLIGSTTLRVVSNPSVASPVPQMSITDLYDLTAQTATATFQPPIGLVTNGQLLRIRVTSSNAATARALTWTSSTGGYIGNSPALPSTTTTGKTSTLGFEYDTSNSVNKWRLIYSANS